MESKRSLYTGQMVRENASDDGPINVARTAPSCGWLACKEREALALCRAVESRGIARTL